MSTIDKHPDYLHLIKAIQKWGGKPKGILVSAVYDASGESYTRAVLQTFSKGRLLAILIDQLVEEGFP